MLRSASRALPLLLLRLLLRTTGKKAPRRRDGARRALSCGRSWPGFRFRELRERSGKRRERAGKERGGGEDEEVSSLSPCLSLALSLSLAPPSHPRSLPPLTLAAASAQGRPSSSSSSLLDSSSCSSMAAGGGGGGGAGIASLRGAQTRRRGRFFRRIRVKRGRASAEKGKKNEEVERPWASLTAFLFFFERDFSLCLALFFLFFLSLWRSTPSLVPTPPRVRAIETEIEGQRKKRKRIKGKTNRPVGI